MNKRVIIGLVAVAAFVALAWALSRPRATAPRAAAPAANDEPAASEAPAQAAQPSAGAGGSGGAAEASQPAPAAATAAPTERPKSKLRIAFDSEPRDATAPAAEAELRAIYDGEPAAKGVLRGVRCTQSVCKIEARWNKELNAGYNAALLKVIHSFGKDLSLEPDGPPDTTATPIAIYVHRPVR
jgi:hypothetical protein